ncbi:Calcium-binding protein krp1 [Orobanche hederae]
MSEHLLQNLIRPKQKKLLDLYIGCHPCIKTPCPFHAFHLHFHPTPCSYDLGKLMMNEFQDMLPFIADKLGGEGLMGELCKGFSLLMDREKGLITYESLKKNSAVLGLHDLRDDELRSMLMEGDINGDGALDEMEFCVLMFRLSPELMQQSEALLEDAIQQEFEVAAACFDRE